MELIAKAKDDTVLLKAVGAMSIYHAAAIRDELVGYLDKYEKLTVDMSEVSDCDTAGIQLILSARTSALGPGKTLTFSGPSAAIKDAFLCAGLQPDGELNLGKGEE